MSEAKTAIKLDNVSKRFNVYSRNIERIKGVIFGRKPAEIKHALKNVSLEIKEGERVVVMGIVDSGRSTLAKIISGVTLPSKGKVDIFGNDPNVMLDAKAGLDMEFSCIDNIYMKANIVGVSKERIKSEVDEILEFAEATNFAELPMKRAPKGTYAPISLAVHLKYDADILIIDEVFSGGGKRITIKCENKMIEYIADNPEKTVLIVSNRIAFAKKIGTRAIILNKGEIVFDGSVNEAGKLFKTMYKKMADKSKTY